MFAQACVSVADDAKGHNFVTEVPLWIFCLVQNLRRTFEMFWWSFFPRTKDQSTKFLQKISFLQIQTLLTKIVLSQFCPKQQRAWKFPRWKTKSCLHHYVIKTSFQNVLGNNIIENGSEMGNSNNGSEVVACSIKLSNIQKNCWLFFYSYKELETMKICFFTAMALNTGWVWTCCKI